MIVSARIFLILLVSLLLHGAPTPSDGNDLQVPSHVKFPWYNAAADTNQPNYQPPPHYWRRLGLDFLSGGKSVFKDFTVHFAVLEPGHEEPCKLPRGTPYRIKSSNRRFSFKEVEAGKSIPIAVPTIAFTKGLLVLLSPGTRVTISESPDSEIQVPNENAPKQVMFWKADKKTILAQFGYVPVARVVNVPSMEQGEIWQKCLDAYKEKSNEVLELNSERVIEIQSKYMCRCFHINMWNIGRGFIAFDVNHLPPDPEGTRKRKRPLSHQSPRCSEHSEGARCGS